MAAQRIRELDDPILRRRSELVADPADAAATLRDLADTLEAFRRERGFGRAISAVQIGRLERVIYLEFDGVSYSLVNPVWESLSGEKFALWDDCFSFPDLMVRVERSRSVRVNYADEHGARQVLNAEGALSELLQHEMDHLDGILAVDRAIDRDSFATRKWVTELQGKDV
jgi:peptide deformylase